jgi:hypothetical protein
LNISRKLEPLRVINRYGRRGEMMNSVKWHTSVVLHSKTDSGEMQAITNTREAAHCLLVYWPDVRGEAYHKAIRTCGLVLRGLVTPEIARQTFLAAAHESSISVLH